jgi:hypothetical protein
MIKGAAGRALTVTALTAAVTGGLHLLGVGLPLLLALAVLVAFVTLVVPWLGVRWLDAIVLQLRSWFWAAEQGRFHSFGGVPLQIDDDGRDVWVDGPGLLRALGRREPEDALAARHAGHWRRDPQGVLMLRVDAVVRYLSAMPGRNEPRIQRLRRYFERDVLYPASQRRQRR